MLVTVSLWRTWDSRIQYDICGSLSDQNKCASRSSCFELVAGKHNSRLSTFRLPWLEWYLKHVLIAVYPIGASEILGKDVHWQSAIEKQGTLRFACFNAESPMHFIAVPARIYDPIIYPLYANPIYRISKGNEGLSWTIYIVSLVVSNNTRWVCQGSDVENVWIQRFSMPGRPHIRLCRSQLRTLNKNSNYLECMQSS